MTSRSTDKPETPEDSRIAAVKAAIWDAFLEIYQGAVTGSRELSNRHIALDATLWDVDEPQLIQGLAELELTRDRRVSADSSLVSISPEPPVIDVWGSTALVRHYFEVTAATASGTELSRVRNTSVWREVSGRWVVVHNHEDAISSRTRPTIEGGKPPE
jgi:ketosteroid isomerase-like protein